MNRLVLIGCCLWLAACCLAADFDPNKSAGINKSFSTKSYSSKSFDTKEFQNKTAETKEFTSKESDVNGRGFETKGFESKSFEQPSSEQIDRWRKLFDQVHESKMNGKGFADNAKAYGSTNFPTRDLDAKLQDKVQQGVKPNELPKRSGQWGYTILGAPPQRLEQQTIELPTIKPTPEDINRPVGNRPTPQK